MEFSELDLLGQISIGIVISILIIGMILMARKLRRPKDKTKLQTLYCCTICGVPFTTQIKLVNHMKDVHDTVIYTSDTKKATEEVTYDDWEVVRVEEEDAEGKLSEMQIEQDEQVSSILTDNPDNDPEEIVDPGESPDLKPEDVFEQVSKKLEQPRVSVPHGGDFFVQYLGDRIQIDISLVVPNSDEVNQAISILNKSMGK